MTTTELLNTLTARGARLEVDGDSLIVRPRDALTDELRNEIRTRKRDLLRLLSEQHAHIERLKAQWHEARQRFWASTDDAQTERAWGELLDISDALFDALGADAYWQWRDGQGYGGVDDGANE